TTNSTLSLHDALPIFGKEFSENLEIKIIKGGTTENYEVDAITGATGTSNAFANLLTANYRKYVYAFSDMDPTAVWKKAMLSHHRSEEHTSELQSREKL